MKRMISALIALLFFFMIVTVLNSDSSDSMGIPRYGEVKLSERVSAKYIEKSVNGNEDEINFGVTADAETGSANMVTSIVVNYRSFDTLGEVTVLFISATGVGLLLGGGRKRVGSAISVSPVVKIASRVIAPLLMVLGIYVFVHGHLTPGGGFPGGAIIAAGFLLLKNFLPTGVVGELFSAGIIPVVYSVIGIKVGAELSGIVDDFISEGGDEA